MPSRRTRVPVLKIKGGGHVLLIVRSAKVVSFTLHWLGRRSYICPGTGCPACEQCVGSRWSAFAGAEYSFGTPEQRSFGLLEFTEGAYERLRFMRETEGRPDFVGLRVVASRSRDRAPLRFDLPDEGPCFVASAKAWDHALLIDALATLYALPALVDLSELERWEKACESRSRLMLGRALAALQ